MPDCPTVTEFKLRFEAFLATPDPKIQLYLDDACDCLSTDLLGESYSKAALYLAAHCLSIAIKTAERSSDSGVPAPEPAGNVTSSSSDGLSMGYSGGAIKGSQANWYSQTPYGRQFLEIIRSCVHTSDTAGFSFC